MSEDTIDAERYSRQLGLLGNEGQTKIERATIAVLGLGGLGSHICQQLAYLGVRHFILVDDDSVEDSNLNRLIGATFNDVGVSKVSVAVKLIQGIQPSASIELIQTKLPDAGAELKIANADLILGCFDNDYPRLITTELAAKYKKPYIDAASDVILEDDMLTYGGRVVVSGDSRGCLSCMQKLDQVEIRRAQMDSAQLETEAKIYGVPVSELRGTGPSVVTINGVVASLAATEAMVLLTDLRKSVKIQTYNGHIGGVTKSLDSPRSTCYYCDNWGV
jgi:hypothetical protein